MGAKEEFGLNFLRKNDLEERSRRLNYKELPGRQGQVSPTLLGHIDSRFDYQRK